MFKHGILTLALIGTVALSSAALAGDGHDPRAVVQHIFDVADADGDGVLTSSEYESAGLERFGVSFDESDGNGDGMTTLDEYVELYVKHHPTQPDTES